jgi:phenylpyruvate tautomerase PptA (4-oxalocrotonate tautomerase family)
MPLVTITTRHGRSAEELRNIGEAIHQALVSTASVPADDRFQIVHEVPASHLVADPAYGGVERSDGLIIIQITLNAGRSVEVKKALYAAIAERLERDSGVRTDDVLISLIEVTKENWSFGGGKATYAQ